MYFLWNFLLNGYLEDVCSWYSPLKPGLLIWNKWWDNGKCINFVCVNQITSNSNTNASTAATNNNNKKKQY